MPNPTVPQAGALASPSEPLPFVASSSGDAAQCPVMHPPPPDSPDKPVRPCPVMHRGTPAPPRPSPEVPLSALPTSERVRKALCSAGFASILTTMVTGAIWQPLITVLVRQQFISAQQSATTIPVPTSTPTPSSTSTTIPSTRATQQALSASLRPSIFSVFRRTAKEGGRVFFRGLTPRLMQSPLACIQWTTYEMFRETVAHRKESSWNSFKYALVFVLSRVLVTTAKCPFEVVKERMQVQGTISGFHALKPHSTAWQHLQFLLQTDGARGLFRALPINICRDIPIAVLMMFGNDFFTHLLTSGSPFHFWDQYFQKDRQMRAHGGKTPSHISFLAGAMAGGLATLATQPVDVAKTVIQTQSLARLQQQIVHTPPAPAVASPATVAASTTAPLPTTTTPATTTLPKMPTFHTRQYRGMIDVLSTLYREQGIRSWFVGTPLRATHIMLGGAVYLPLYRSIQQQLKFGFELLPFKPSQ